MFKIPVIPKSPVIEPYVSFNGVKVNLDKLPEQSIDLDFYNETDIRGNTPGRNELIKKYDNQTLAYKINKNILPNCSLKDDITYDGALQKIYVPELLKRIGQLEIKIKHLEEKK